MCWKVEDVCSKRCYFQKLIHTVGEQKTHSHIHNTCVNCLWAHFICVFLLVLLKINQGLSMIVQKQVNKDISGQLWILNPGSLRQRCRKDPEKSLWHQIQIWISPDKRFKSASHFNNEIAAKVKDPLGGSSFVIDIWVGLFCLEE